MAIDYYLLIVTNNIFTKKQKDALKVVVAHLKYKTGYYTCYYNCVSQYNQSTHIAIYVHRRYRTLE